VDVVTLDRQLVSAARRVRILGSLTWPSTLESRFLTAWRAGAPALPDPPPVTPPSGELAEPLADVVARADAEHPAGAFLIRTAESYLTAIQLLRSAGTPGFLTASQALFGEPQLPPFDGAPTPLQEAEHLIEAAEAMSCAGPVATLSDEEASARLSEAFPQWFDDPLPVVLDPDLGSLAAAGSRRVRLRAGVRYTEAQVDQLLQHEALVHAATKRNGRRQPMLTSLGLSSPRTTATQEGLATLAELMTNSMDLLRLRRIALRVRAVHAATQGADFIDVFELLLEAGQPEVEAYRSTMRVFRGGDVRGGIPFTKDVVYLRGLREVHTFLLAALREHRDDLPQRLFLGRLTCGDALALGPLIDNGTLLPAAIVPTWIQRSDHLAATLSWTVFGQHTPLHRIDLEDFLEDQ